MDAGTSEPFAPALGDAAVSAGRPDATRRARAKEEGAGSDTHSRVEGDTSDELVDNNVKLEGDLSRVSSDKDRGGLHASKSGGCDPRTDVDALLQRGEEGGGAGDTAPMSASRKASALRRASALRKHRKHQRVNFIYAFNQENIKVTVVSIICGLITGYVFAIVPVYVQMVLSATNCAHYTAQKGCETVPFADCKWYATTVTRDDGTVESLDYCGWPTITCRAAYPNDDWAGGGGNTTLARLNCLEDSRCTWSYKAKECQNPAGYSQRQLSIFAGSLIAGNMFGAILGGPLVTSMGARLTFFTCGFFSIVTCVMCHVDAFLMEFWVHTTGRFVLGIFMGLVTVACPLYIHENANPKYKRVIGMMFQIFFTAGAFITGLGCLIVGETLDYDANADQHMSGRMQGIVGVMTLMSAMLTLLGIFCPETKVKFKKGVHGALNQSEYSYLEMAPRLLMVVALNGTFRFTGFNAVVIFGPKLMESFNIEPYLGVFIILAVNFLGGVLSIPVSRYFPLKELFLFGSFFVSCMSLFLCGVAVYPGVASESVTNNCAVVGMCLYIFVYEVLVGPGFYVLCQEIFPPSFRPRGNSFAQLWQFTFNLLTNVCFPIATVRFSGGESGNQHKGQSIIFIFFGALGLVLFAYEFFCLELWDEEAEVERKLRAAEAAAMGAMSLVDGAAADEVPAEELPEPTPMDQEDFSWEEEVEEDEEEDEEEGEGGSGSHEPYSEQQLGGESRAERA